MRPFVLRHALGAIALFAACSTSASAQWANTGSIAAATDPIWSVHWRGINGATALVPEPSTAALLVTGLAGLLLVVRKRRLR